MSTETNTLADMPASAKNVLIVLLVLSVPAIVLLQAFALSTLWGWFVTRLGVPAISLGTAYGLTLIVNLFRDFPKPKGEEAWRALGGSIGGPWQR